MYGNKKETDKKGAGKKGMPRVRERIWDEYENGWHCTVPSLWMGGEDLIMTCDGCKAKDVGACTAHGGVGWDPRVGSHPCPEAGIVPGPCAAVLGKKKPAPIIVGS